MKNRSRLKPKSETCLQNWLAKCFKSLHKDKKFALRAQEELEKELDVQRLIRGSRLVQNLLKILTTKRERRLSRMQANKNTVSHNHANDLISTENDSQQDRKYLEDLKAHEELLELSKREMILMRGIATSKTDFDRAL